MAAKDKVRALTKVVEVRQTQRQAAEATLARAIAARRDLAELAERQGDLLRGHQQSWTQIILGRALDLPIAQSWSAAIDRAASELSQTTGRLAQAEQDGEQATAALIAARARCETAQSLARSLRRAVLHKSEEAALADSLDQWSHRRWPS